MADDLICDFGDSGLTLAWVRGRCCFRSLQLRLAKNLEESCTQTRASSGFRRVCTCGAFRKAKPAFEGGRLV